MKTINTMLVTISLGITLLTMGACSRSPDQTTTMGSTPNPEHLKADAERLRQATEKAAEARKNAQKLVNPTPTTAP